MLTLAGKVTNKLPTYISLKMAERSEAKSAKRKFASKKSSRFSINRAIFDDLSLLGSILTDVD